LFVSLGHREIVWRTASSSPDPSSELATLATAAILVIVKEGA